MTLGVWELARDEETLQASGSMAVRERPPPDFHVEVVSRRGDHVTVQIASGALRDPAAILLLEGTGTFEIVRVEPWPAGRMLLVVRAWPAGREGA